MTTPSANGGRREPGPEWGPFSARPEVPCPTNGNRCAADGCNANRPHQLGVGTHVVWIARVSLAHHKIDGLWRPSVTRSGQPVHKLDLRNEHGAASLWLTIGDCYRRVADDAFILSKWGEVVDCAMQTNGRPPLTAAPKEIVGRRITVTAKLDPREKLRVDNVAPAADEVRSA